MLTMRRTAGTIVVRTPYNDDFRGRAWSLGGKYRPAEKAWAFPVDREPQVMALCEEVFRARPMDPSDAGVVVRITARRDMSVLRESVRFSGRVVARATARDSGARPGPHVALISGTIRSSGSARHWRTAVDAGAVFELDRMPPDAAVSDHWWTAEVLRSARSDSDPEELAAERARLKARLAEIDPSAA